YTAFEIGEAEVDKTTLKANETVKLSIPVTNKGKRDGTEIVQVYVRKINDIEGPLKTLKGFKRVSVPKGKTEKVTILLPPSSFEFYDWGLRKMAVTSGEYEIYYGNSSAAKDLKTKKISITAQSFKPIDAPLE
ncbi:MAG: fibronectin type III-like domain-contianing protein, partial [Prolixibacteraceae bacterium]|nr:fibronectin type III-like domain-contianing protein [Prolixibacteraceae bacterium]